ncbi:hypothetical protein [Bordetella genomosp. 13]|uniref:Glycosyltransferase RgtA/B/C/D-like domain-containing protein n=1 Tax=Bordetella genomosp. 13 TaxID=463040 RepID=A0A1W6ZI79_9BORD|nr:hypothetical protein [Bordetella genomosp. 13]ARP96977.1 hypothetical protein CAL15_22955 [Bordetella genomosp. 13]
MPGRIPTQLWENVCALGVLIAGLSARLWVIAHIPLEPISDFKRYYMVAETFANVGSLSADGFPYIIQGPLYPVMLGLTFKAFGPGVLQGQILNLLLSAVAIICITLAARNVLRPGWLRLVPPALLAAHPGAVLYVNVLGTECLSLAAVAAAILASVCRGRSAAIALGVLLALLSLNRPQFLPVVLLFVLLRRPGLRSMASGFAWCVIPFMLAMTPWTLRNYAVFDRFIPTSASSGYILLVNNNDANIHSGWMPLTSVAISDEDKARFDRDGAISFFDESDEGLKVLRWTPANDALARELAIKWIKDHPARFAELGWKRIQTTMWMDYGDMLLWPLHDVGPSRPLFEVTRALDLTLFTVAILGFLYAVVYRRDGTLWRACLIPALVTAGGLAAIFVFEGQGRYLLPMIPAVALMVCLVRPRSWVGARQTMAGTPPYSVRVTAS